MRRGVLIVFAKRPEPGRVKTRLSPPLTPVQAAELYRAMLGDVLEASAAMAARGGLDPVLAVAPAEAGAELAQSAPPSFRVVAQRGADLSERMEWAVAEAAASGGAPILLRGSDSPALDPGAALEALDALIDHDLVLCPDLDGGYGLVGLARTAPALFSHPMSTRRVLEDTHSRALHQGLRVKLLTPRFDIDGFDDLQRLAALRETPVGALCAQTLTYLDVHALWPKRR